MSKLNGAILTLLDTFAARNQVLGLQEGFTRGSWYTKEGDPTPTGEAFFKKRTEMTKEINEIKAQIINLIQ